MELNEIKEQLRKCEHKEHHGATRTYLKIIAETNVAILEELRTPKVPVMKKEEKNGKL